MWLSAAQWRSFANTAHPTLSPQGWLRPFLGKWTLRAHKEIVLWTQEGTLLSTSIVCNNMPS